MIADYTCTTKPSSPMNRRFFLSLMGAASLSGCASNNNALRTLKTAFDNSFGNPSAFEPDYPDKLPYASIAVSTPNRPKILLVLGKAIGDELHWISADRGVLVTRHGRIIKTVGLQENLDHTNFTEVDFLENPLQHSHASYRRVSDFSPGHRYGIQIDAKIQKAGEEKISIGQKEFFVQRHIEECHAATLGWKSQNIFWIDQSGFTWKSQQYSTPNQGPFTLEITKPYGKKQV